MKKVKVERTKNDLIVFTIQRPDKRNAIDYDVMNELEQALDMVQTDQTVKAFVITGEGSEAFCSGGDLSVFHNLYTKEEAYNMLSKMGRILYNLLTLNRPTIALLNGIAIGGGCEIATACDFRIARQHAKMGFVQGSLAITTGWGGGTMLLEKLPHDKAFTLLLSAKTFMAREAKEIGFIQEVLSDDNWFEEGISWVDNLLKRCSPSVLQAYKEISVNKWNHSTIKERMLEEIDQCSILWEKEEHHSAVKDFFEKKRKS